MIMYKANCSPATPTDYSTHCYVNIASSYYFILYKFIIYHYVFAACKSQVNKQASSQNSFYTL